MIQLELNQDSPTLLGAIEGTRTPTPLPVHGPEPCASANSATMASGLQSRQARTPPHPEDLHFYSTSTKAPVKSPPRRKGFILSAAAFQHRGRSHPAPYPSALGNWVVCTARSAPIPKIFPIMNRGNSANHSRLNPVASLTNWRTSPETTATPAWHPS